MPNEKKPPKLLVKQPGRDLRITRDATVLASKKVSAKKAAPAKRAAKKAAKKSAR